MFNCVFHHNTPKVLDALLTDYVEVKRDRSGRLKGHKDKISVTQNEPKEYTFEEIADLCNLDTAQTKNALRILGVYNFAEQVNDKYRLVKNKMTGFYGVLSFIAKEKSSASLSDIFQNYIPNLLDGFYADPEFGFKIEELAAIYSDEGLTTEKAKQDLEHLKDLNIMSYRKDNRYYLKRNTLTGILIQADIECHEVNSKTVYKLLDAKDFETLGKEQLL